MAEMNLDFEDVTFSDFKDESQSEFDNPLESLPPAKKNMVMFFVIDTSSSMAGSRIDTMNEAMRNVLPELIGVGGTNTDLRIAVLTFSSGTEWITSEPMILEEYQDWKDLVADGVTDLGEALTELNEKMSRKSFLRAPSLSYAPVVFLITDGFPTDNYQKGLELIKNNKWFQVGIKMALALGDGVDMDVLAEFTGDEAFVVQANNLSQMKALIRTIAVTSSQIGSSSMPLVSEDLLDPGDVVKRGPTKQEQMKEILQDIRIDIMNGAEGSYFDVEDGW